MQQEYNKGSDFKSVKETEQYLLSLADNMASAATTFNSHGYEIFLQSRNQFIEQLHFILQSSV